MKAVAYLRASREEQRLTPAVQRAEIEAWAAKAGHEVVSWHTDIDISGTSEIQHRPHLLEALDALKAVGKGGILVAQRRDRIARDVVIAAMIELAVSKAGCTLVSADGLGNGAGPGDTLVRQILNAVAQFEVAMIRLRTRGALAALKAKGQRVSGQAPIGYRFDAGRPVPDEGEQRMLAQARHLAPGRTASEVARLLTAQGFTSREGGSVRAGTVARALRTPPASLQATA